MCLAKRPGHIRQDVIARETRTYLVVNTHTHTHTHGTDTQNRDILRLVVVYILLYALKDILFIWDGLIGLDDAR